MNWRPITADDVPAWASLLAAAEAADATGEHYDTDDLLDELADPALDPARDTVAAFADGRMLAYGLTRGCATVGGIHQVDIEGCVHPEWRRRGIGRKILRRTAGRAADVHRERHGDHPGHLRAFCHDDNTGAVALLIEFGMRPARWWCYLRRSLATPPAPAPVPDGLRLVLFDFALNEAVRVAHNEAFADHWGSAEHDSSSWRQWFTGSRSFRPELSWVLLDGGTVAGYLNSYEYPADGKATGVREAWIGQLGVRRPWRGRGAGSALLTAALAGYARAGYQQAALRVDTDNPSGAFGLYGRSGFAAVQRWTTYVRPL
jgi:mycothiol synthase